jgi:hypothetical protein
MPQTIFGGGLIAALIRLTLALIWTPSGFDLCLISIRLNPDEPSSPKQNELGEIRDGPHPGTSRGAVGSM